MPQDVDEIPEEHFGIDCDLFATGKVLYVMLNNDENITMFPYIDKKILSDKLARNCPSSLCKKEKLSGGLSGGFFTL